MAVRAAAAPHRPESGPTWSAMLDADHTPRRLADVVAIGVAQVDCRAHFFVRRGQIVWALKATALVNVTQSKGLRRFQPIRDRSSAAMAGSPFYRAQLQNRRGVEPLVVFRFMARASGDGEPQQNNAPDHGHVVVLGEAGSGKSVVARRAIEHAAEQGRLPISFH